jgi:hypothetical protein
MWNAPRKMSPPTRLLLKHLWGQRKLCVTTDRCSLSALMPGRRYHSSGPVLDAGVDAVPPLRLQAGSPDEAPRKEPPRKEESRNAATSISSTIDATNIPDTALPPHLPPPPLGNPTPPPWRQKLQYQLQYVEYVWKREVALFQYYGFLQYMQQQYRDLILPGRPFTTVDASTTVAAKVPFVLTTKLRTELMERGGCSEAEIRQMTPQQAHARLELVRRHSYRSSNHPSPPQTVDEFHAATVLDAQSVAEFHDAPGESTSSDHRHDDTTTTWYEIVQAAVPATTEDDDADAHVATVALYLHEKDALFGLTIYEELARKNQAAPWPTYSIRTTRK